jgi:hypothetical protein
MKLVRGEKNKQTNNAQTEHKKHSTKQTKQYTD